MPLDAALAAAVDLARAAAAEEAGGAVGDHLGVDVEDDRVATHRFVSLTPGYVGWEWSVTLARASRAKDVTVDEVCLLPGPGALVAPEWVPYSERLRPGDLGPGDILPASPDDDRLEPGWTGGFEALARDADDADATAYDEPARLAWELGLGRRRVLSLLGLDDATDRWVNGPGGPDTPVAEQAPARCATCGFLLRLGGVAGQAFGVCANEFSPSDGRVVSHDHGCGAHSEASDLLALTAATVPVLDEVGYDLLVTEPAGYDELGHG